MWMKALQHQWFSTMYGVYYFAGCVWVALAAAYVIAMILDRQGLIRDTMGAEQYYFLGSLLFAFTVFSAYIHFGQYFVIWNANMPEETFWYVLREKGSWFAVGLVLIFGHFLVPFLALLRIDVKLVFRFMLPLCAWIGLMQYVDLSFNIMPVLHPNGVALAAGFGWMPGAWRSWAACWPRCFVRDLNRYPAYPVKDPRLAEAMGLYPEVLKPNAGGGAWADGQVVRRSAAFRRRWPMNPQPARERTGLAYLIGILGSFLIVAALVWAMQHYTQPPPLGEDRVAVRKKALADLRAAEASELESYGWVDQAKGVVRLPIAEAMKLALRDWQNPAAARSNLIARVEKATAVPPAAPAKPSPFE